MITGISSLESFNTTAHTVASLKSEEVDAASDRHSRVDRLEMSPEMFREELERIREQAEAAAKEGDSLAKAMRITMRIIKGDIVPDKDDKWLLENYPDMHMRAWLLRQNKVDPKRYKSEFDDDNSIQDVQLELELAGIDIKQIDISTALEALDVSV